MSDSLRMYRAMISAGLGDTALSAAGIGVAPPQLQSAVMTGAAKKKRFDVEVGSEIREWLREAVGVHARPYVHIALFSRRVFDRMNAESSIIKGDDYGPLAESGDADCVVLMRKPEDSASGAVLALKVPDQIIEQIISDEVREKMGT